MFCSNRDEVAQPAGRYTGGWAILLGEVRWKEGAQRGATGRGRTAAAQSQPAHLCDARRAARKDQRPIRPGPATDRRQTTAAIGVLQQPLTMGWAVMRSTHSTNSVLGCLLYKLFWELARRGISKRLVRVNRINLFAENINPKCFGLIFKLILIFVYDS